MVNDAERDEGQLAEMYLRFAPGGIRLGYLMTGDRATAEDLVQEAFIHFVGRLHSLHDPDAFDAHLRRTVINLSKNYFRRRALEHSDLERQASQRRPIQEERDVSEYEAMRLALLGLPARQRAAIVLRYCPRGVRALSRVVTERHAYRLLLDGCCWALPDPRDDTGRPTRDRSRRPRSDLRQMQLWRRSLVVARRHKARGVGLPRRSLPP